MLGSVTLAVVWGWSSSLPVTGPLGFALGGGHALPARLLQFVFGMACAAAVVRGQGGRVSWWVTAAATLWLVAAVATTTDQPMVIKHVAWGLLGVALVMLACGLQLRGQTFNLSEGFGERAYSFYLLHQPVLLVMAPVVELLPGGWPIQLIVGGLAAFFLVTGLAAIMYRVVELPTHRLGRRLFPRPSPAVAPDQSQST